MNALALEWGVHVLALVFLAGALACALATAMSRSLFAMCMSLASAHACAAVVLMSFGAGDASLTLAVFGAGFAPVLILAGLLLSSRAAKTYKRGPVLLAAVSAALAGVAMLWATPELGATAATVGRTYGATGPWLAALMFVTAIGCVGLLGYGERGPFERRAS
jgi:hypothetical protein